MTLDWAALNRIQEFSTTAEDIRYNNIIERLDLIIQLLEKEGE